MAATVLLKDIVDGIEMQFDESSSFLDLDTGQVETVSDDLLRRAEDSIDGHWDLPTWQEQEWEVAKKIVSTNRFRRLRTKFDVHEWAIMRDFSYWVPSETVRRDLLDAIHGAGAFWNFKAALRRHKMESAWFTFHAEVLTQIARDWCEEHHIKWQ